MGTTDRSSTPKRSAKIAAIRAMHEASLMTTGMDKIQTPEDLLVRVREETVRRAASRRDLKAVKSPSRTPEAAEYGRWMIVDPYNSNAVVAGGTPTAYSMSLEDVEAFLAEEDSHRTQ